MGEHPQFLWAWLIFLSQSLFGDGYWFPLQRPANGCNQTTAFRPRYSELCCDPGKGSPQLFGLSRIISQVSKILDVPFELSESLLSSCFSNPAPFPNYKISSAPPTALKASYNFFLRLIRDKGHRTSREDLSVDGFSESDPRVVRGC